MSSAALLTSLHIAVGVCLAWYFKQVAEISAERITSGTFALLLFPTFEIPDCLKKKAEMRIYYGPSHALHNINFHEIASSGNRVACGQTDRQADRYDGAFVVFCKSANSPENECFTVRTLTKKKQKKAWCLLVVRNSTIVLGCDIIVSLNICSFYAQYLRVFCRLALRKFRPKINYDLISVFLCRFTFILVPWIYSTRGTTFWHVSAFRMIDNSMIKSLYIHALTQSVFYIFFSLFLARTQTDPTPTPNPVKSGRHTNSLFDCTVLRNHWVSVAHDI